MEQNSNIVTVRTQTKTKTKISVCCWDLLRVSRGTRGIQSTTEGSPDPPEDHLDISRNPKQQSDSMSTIDLVWASQTELPLPQMARNRNQKPKTLPGKIQKLLDTRCHKTQRMVVLVVLCPCCETTEPISDANTQGFIDYKLRLVTYSSSLTQQVEEEDSTELSEWRVFKRKNHRQGGTSLCVIGLGEGM